jgi:hypothetical protein
MNNDHGNNGVDGDGDGDGDHNGEESEEKARQSELSKSDPIYLSEQSALPLPLLVLPPLRGQAHTMSLLWRRNGFLSLWKGVS